MDMAIIHDFFSLLYPRLCLGCNKNLQKNEHLICMQCDYHLPKTNFHLIPGNPVEQVFWGKIELHAATSLYFFHKAGKVQRIIHELKYNGNKAVGIFLGKKLGLEIKDHPNFKDVDVLIPVPLHPKKLRSRGYNQSEVFAQGLAQVLGVDVDRSSLFRNRFTETQTKKSRFDRWKNVSEKFSIADNNNLNGKHVLLVDDVLTTGSTLEACAQSILKAGDVKLSIATIAITS